MQDDMPPRVDRAMLARVIAALSDPALGLSDVQAEYIEGTVILRGRAGSEDARKAATAIAQRVSGAAGVENRIRTG